MINLACYRAPLGPTRYVRWAPYPVLASEGPQGYSLPLLYVSCTPVIHEHHAEEVASSLCCADCTAQGSARTNQSCLASKHSGATLRGMGGGWGEGGAEMVEMRSNKSCLALKQISRSRVVSHGGEGWGWWGSGPVCWSSFDTVRHVETTTSVDHLS